MASSAPVAFDTVYPAILDRLSAIDPVAYKRTRNYVDGAVTRLSPYISRGVISTRQVMQSLLESGAEYGVLEKLLQELAWRDYWQQVWIAKGDDVNGDLKHAQAPVSNHEMPRALQSAQTTIDAMDDAVNELYETGYMHNHMRMYVASTACNIARSHWHVPARWMYYHLLDGDWASNALSWQWVAGSNANKKYYANQENINRFFHSSQTGTFLDTTYEELPVMAIPEVLRETGLPELRTSLPVTDVPQLDNSLPTLVYNYYNLDPQWRKTENANRVLLLEPSVFERYPVADRNIEFVLQLAQNIPGIQISSAEFSELCEDGEIIYKEHPLNRHYQGHEDARDWMFPVTGYYPSFFAFWKRCKKSLDL